MTDQQRAAALRLIANVLLVVARNPAPKVFDSALLYEIGRYGYGDAEAEALEDLRHLDDEDGRT